MSNVGQESGIIATTQGICGALKLPIFTSQALASDGEAFTGLRLLQDNARTLVAFELGLRVLGYHLDLVQDRQTDKEDLTTMEVEQENLDGLVALLPQQIPLPEPDRAQTVQQLRILAQGRFANFCLPDGVDLAAFSEHVARAVVRKPRPTLRKVVELALDAFPILFTAHQVENRYLPILTGQRIKIWDRWAAGGPETKIDRHLRLWARFGLYLRISGPAGTLMVKPALRRSVTYCMRVVARLRLEAVDLSAKLRRRAARAGRKSPAPKSKAPGTSALSRDEIVELLRAGTMKPLQVAEKAGVTHQRIYTIMREEGLSARALKARASSQILVNPPGR